MTVYWCSHLETKTLSIHHRIGVVEDFINSGYYCLFVSGRLGVLTRHCVKASGADGVLGELRLLGSSYLDQSGGRNLLRIRKPSRFCGPQSSHWMGII